MPFRDIGHATFKIEDIVLDPRERIVVRYTKSSSLIPTWRTTRLLKLILWLPCLTCFIKYLYPLRWQTRIILCFIIIRCLTVICLSRIRMIGDPLIERLFLIGDWWHAATRNWQSIGCVCGAGIRWASHQLLVWLQLRLRCHLLLDIVVALGSVLLLLVVGINWLVSRCLLTQF